MDRSAQKVLRGLEIKSINGICFFHFNTTRIPTTDGCNKRLVIGQYYGDVRLSTSVIDGQTCLRTDGPNLMIEKLRF